MTIYGSPWFRSISWTMTPLFVRFFLNKCWESSYPGVFWRFLRLRVVTGCEMYPGVDGFFSLSPPIIVIQTGVPQPVISSPISALQCWCWHSDGVMLQLYYHSAGVMLMSFFCCCHAVLTNWCNYSDVILFLPCYHWCSHNTVMSVSNISTFDRLSTLLYLLPR